jgi:hypothetical protein
MQTLKETADEADLGTQYHLSRYAYLFENVLVNDGLTVSPLGIEDGPSPPSLVFFSSCVPLTAKPHLGPGLKATLESIDNRDDFKSFMENFAIAWSQSGQRGPRRDVPEEELVRSFWFWLGAAPRCSEFGPTPPGNQTGFPYIVTATSCFSYDEHAIRAAFGIIVFLVD